VLDGDHKLHEEVYTQTREGKENAQGVARKDQRHPNFHEEKPGQHQFDEQSSFHLPQAPVECDYLD
jgi:hypothetical protein